MAGAGRPGRRRWLVGIDVGGTFTDAVAVAVDGAIRTAKVPSTPDDPARALGDALSELSHAGVDPAAIRLLVHGTTIATNAILERRLARVVLVMTEGFRDVLAIGTGMRRDVYDLWAPGREPLVADEDRLEARERMGPRGKPIRPLTEREVARVARAVAGRSPESVAVSCLFSYVDDIHERRLAAAIADRLPQVPITTSSDVAREAPEYPRTHTTVVAAGLRPVVERYLRDAERLARRTGVEAPFLVMQSNGGTAPAARAAGEPHHLVLSGPAGGVAGALAVGARLGLGDLVSLDMGGTSTDVCLVRDGTLPTTSSQELDGAPILSPAVDIVTAGAGGGSIARVDAAGVLRVGPESAAADPGPASYGRGGTEATVTDAHLMVGDLGPGTSLAGHVPLHADLAAEALGRLGRALGLAPEDAGEAVLTVARAHLARAIRRVSVERGRDPRGLSLVAFGGAGPLHGGVLLRELRLGEVVVPPRPGLGSAEGLLASDLRHDASQTVLARLDTADPRQLLEWYRATSIEVARRLRADGIAPGRQRVAATADCRYLGQGFALSVPLPSLTPRGVRSLSARFHEIHRSTYGHAAPDEPVEAVTLRLSAYGALDRPEAGPLRPGRRGGRPGPDAQVGERRVLLPGARRGTSVAVWRRDGLRAGDRLDGPCIVEQSDATTLILAGMSARVACTGDLRMREAASW